jgi:hypothetical protein
MVALPHASEEQAARAIAHVSCVLLAAKNGNQHNENMIVLMDQATAMFQRIATLEALLAEVVRPYGLSDIAINQSHGEDCDAFLDLARRIEAALAQAPQQHQPTTR